jgi:hypothetical protein
VTRWLSIRMAQQFSGYEKMPHGTGKWQVPAAWNKAKNKPHKAKHKKHVPDSCLTYTGTTAGSWIMMMTRFDRAWPSL